MFKSSYQTAKIERAEMVDGRLKLIIKTDNGDTVCHTLNHQSPLTLSKKQLLKLSIIERLVCAMFGEDFYSYDDMMDVCSLFTYRELAHLYMLAKEEGLL